jgi:hypothetical protein
MEGYFRSAVASCAAHANCLSVCIQQWGRKRVHHTQFVKNRWLVSLLLSFMHRVNCVVSKAHGASDEGSRRLGSRIWLQYWSKREHRWETDRLAHWRESQRWAYIAAGCMLSKGCTVLGADQHTARRPGWGAKTQRTPRARSPTHFCMCCWQAHVIIGLHLRAVRLCLRFKCWLFLPGSPYPLNCKVLSLVRV